MAPFGKLLIRFINKNKKIQKDHTDMVEQDQFGKLKLSLKLELRLLYCGV